VHAECLYKIFLFQVKILKPIIILVVLKGFFNFVLILIHLFYHRKPKIEIEEFILLFFGFLMLIQQSLNNL